MRDYKDEFIEKALKIYGDKYDYENIEYVNKTTDVSVFCNIHQKYFHTKPTNHLRGGSLCPDCAKILKKEKLRGSFIKNAVKVHGNRYDYSFVEYENALVKVEIICEKHGPFWQRPSDHTHGKANCPKCKFKGFSADEMIEKLKEKRGKRYIFDKSVYSRSGEKIIVTCRNHGDFEASYSAMSAGMNCPKCSLLARRRKCSMSKDEFVKRAEKIHKGRFDYSRTRVILGDPIVTICCKKHGNFTTHKASHLAGSAGCKECAREEVGDRRRSNTEEFIEKALDLHGGKYDYSKVDYTLNFNPITVICPKHGEFLITPASHLKGGNCQKCVDDERAYSWSKDYCRQYENSNIYLIEFSKSENERFLKLGLSIEPFSRARSVAREVGFDYEVLVVLSGPSDILWNLERRIHTDSEYAKIRENDWTFGGKTECYDITEKENLKLQLLHSDIIHEDLYLRDLEEMKIFEEECEEYTYE